MGQLLTKTVFLLKMSHIQNNAFLLFWSIFGEIHWKLLFLAKKVTISERSSEILRIFFSSTSLKRGKSRRKFGYVVKPLFVQSSKTGKILTKTVFFLKMSHIPPNDAFLLFWSIFGLIHWKLLFFVKKVTSQKDAQKYSEIFFFLTSLKSGPTKSKIWICLNNCFWSSQWKGENINKNFFFLKMSHIQRNYTFLWFWSIFRKFPWKLHFLVKKVAISETIPEILRKFVFLNKFEKGQIQKKIWIFCKQPFLFKAVKRIKY